MTAGPDGYLTTSQMLARGWTRRLIGHFLGTDDGRVRVAHWANFQGTPIYAIARVEAAEATDEFAKEFLRSWKGRMKGRSPAKVLAELRAQHGVRPGEDGSTGDGTTNGTG